MFTSIASQDGPSELQPHPLRLTLRGWPGALQFPSLCASCGAPAAGTIDIAKVFRRVDIEGPNSYSVQSATVPFCAACLDAHRAAATTPTLADKLLSSFVGAEMLGAVFPAIAAAFAVWLALGDLLHARGAQALFILGLGAFFAVIAWVQGSGVWRDNERFRIPPQTEVTKSFDFSANVSPPFEAQRFVCTMRNALFADALRALNTEMAYRADSPEARTERRRSKALTWAFGALMLLFALWSMWKDGRG